MHNSAHIKQDMLPFW